MCLDMSNCPAALVVVGLSVVVLPRTASGE